MSHPLLAHMPVKTRRTRAKALREKLGAQVELVPASYEPTDGGETAETGSGESGRADRVVEAADFPGPVVEDVLVTRRDGGALTPAPSSHVADALDSVPQETVQPDIVAGVIREAVTALAISRAA